MRYYKVSRPGGSLIVHGRSYAHIFIKIPDRSIVHEFLKNLGFFESNPLQIANPYNNQIMTNVHYDYYPITQEEYEIQEGAGYTIGRALVKSIIKQKYTFNYRTVCTREYPAGYDYGNVLHKIWFFKTECRIT